MRQPHREHENENLDLPKQSVTFSEALDQSLRLLGAAFCREITEAMVIAYAIGLHGYEGFQIARATRWLLENHRGFFPSPGDIVAAIHGTAPPEVKTTDTPPLSTEECATILANIKSAMPWIGEKSKPAGVVEITDEMRAEHKRKAAEAAAKFSKTG